MERRRLRADTLAGSTLKEEEMRHPTSVWTDPDFATEPLDKLVAEPSLPIVGETRETG